MPSRIEYPQWTPNTFHPSFHILLFQTKTQQCSCPSLWLFCPLSPVSLEGFTPPHPPPFPSFSWHCNCEEVRLHLAECYSFWVSLIVSSWYHFTHSSSSCVSYILEVSFSTITLQLTNWHTVLVKLKTSLTNNWSKVTGMNRPFFANGSTELFVLLLFRWTFRQGHFVDSLCASELSVRWADVQFDYWAVVTTCCIAMALHLQLIST